MDEPSGMRLLPRVLIPARRQTPFKLCSQVKGESLIYLLSDLILLSRVSKEDPDP